VPSTKADEGDPLDIMVIHGAATFPGIVLTCRIIGILQIEQKSKGKAERNVHDYVNVAVFCKRRQVDEVGLAKHHENEVCGVAQKGNRYLFKDFRREETILECGSCLAVVAVSAFAVLYALKVSRACLALYRRLLSRHSSSLLLQMF
jgi:Inorganic pyrophosphatase